MQTDLDKLIMDDTVITQFLQQYNVSSLERRARRVREQCEEWTDAERDILDTILAKCAYWRNAPQTDDAKHSLVHFFQTKLRSLTHTYYAHWKPYSDSIAQILQLSLSELQYILHEFDPYYALFTRLFHLYERTFTLKTEERVSLDFIEKKTQRLHSQLHERKYVIEQYHWIQNLFEEEMVKCFPPLYAQLESGIQDLLARSIFLTEKEYQDLSVIQLQLRRTHTRLHSLKKDK